MVVGAHAGLVSEQDHGAFLGSLALQFRVNDFLPFLHEFRILPVGTASLRDFKNQAIARLATQHDEITRLRQDARLAAGVRRLPVPPAQEQNPS